MKIFEPRNHLDAIKLRAHQDNLSVCPVVCIKQYLNAAQHIVPAAAKLGERCLEKKLDKQNNEEEMESLQSFMIS